MKEWGDLDQIYISHLIIEQVCLPSRCNNPTSNVRFYADRPLHRRLLGWDCDSECKYDCMWEAVEFFQKHDIDIPQFYGKWPFVRWMGMQARKYICMANKPGKITSNNNDKHLHTKRKTCTKTNYAEKKVQNNR